MSFISTSFQTKPGRIARLVTQLPGGDGAGGMLRGALFAFGIRVSSAGLAFFSQILLARWMGAYEYGLFAYVWVWVIVLGTIAPFGLNSAVLRFVPQYRARGDMAHLRGFLFAGSWVSFAAGSIIAVLGAVFLYVAGDGINSAYIIPFYLGLVCLPLFALGDFLEGVGRARSWIGLALAPPYIVRPLVLLGLMGLVMLAGGQADAKTAMLAATGASWLVAAGQFVLLKIRLKREIGAGERQYEIPLWLKISMPLLLVEGFSLLLLNTDIMVMSAYLSPVEVAHYFAAVKVTGLISFVYYAVVAASAQKFAEYGALRDHEKLAALVRRSARWTFWPSLVAAICILGLGWPLLWLFGEGFTGAWPVMFILAFGILVRASIGPLDYVLNMLGEQNLTAVILGFAAAFNLALNFIAIPYFGLLGAAAATSASLVMVSLLLKIAAHSRLGLHASPLEGQNSAVVTGDGEQEFVVEQIDDFSAMRQITQQWQRLSDNALAANPVYAPDMALAAYEHLGKNRGRLKAICVWRGGSLVGFLPYLEGVQISGWQHIYGFCGAPLVSNQHGVTALAKMFTYFAQRRRICRLQLLPLDGAFGDAMAEACRSGNLLYEVLESHERAVFEPASYGGEVLQKILSRQRRKTLRRQQRRLGEKGELEFEIFAAGDDIEVWGGEFLELEAKGWKGAAKTAMLCKSEDTDFMRHMLDMAAGGGRLEFYSLTLDGRPIAMSMAVKSGAGLFFFKMAYDEAYRAHSPGMVLFAAITQQLGADCDIEFADSCSSPDHPLLDHMWPGRRRVGHVLVSDGSVPAGRVKFAAAVLGLRAAIRLRKFAKRLYSEHFRPILTS